MRKSLPGRRIIAVGSLVALLAATTAAPVLAAADPIREALGKLVADGVPGAEAVVTDHRHTTVTRAGTGDLTTGKPFPRNGSFRSGSVTKTFVATVVLQLVAEGKVQLDAPIERYLPGLITGNGNDGAKITVRQLLQHTSGLYNYLVDFAGVDPETLRHQGGTPAGLVAMALKHAPLFTPGTKWSYSNTNYIVAGMLVEKITGRPLDGEIARRITRPLGLRDTYLPGHGDERLPAPHAVGYTPINGKLVDFSDFDATIAWGAGGLVTTPTDLNTFYAALLGGRLLPAAQLAEMRRGVPAKEIDVPGATYGLGLGSFPLPCGGEFSGHGGEIDGFLTLSGVSSDGRAATVVGNVDPAPPGAVADQVTVLETALCSGK